MKARSRKIGLRYRGDHPGSLRSLAGLSLPRHRIASAAFSSLPANRANSWSRSSEVSSCREARQASEPVRTYPEVKSPELQSGQEARSQLLSEGVRLPVSPAQKTHDAF